MPPTLGGLLVATHLLASGCVAKSNAPALPASVERAEAVAFELAPAPMPDPVPGEHWRLPPLQAEDIMRSCEIRAQHKWPAGGGVTGALKVALYSPEAGKQFLAKWKRVPRGLDSWNNSPRRELAAYEVQKLFLEPADYVVPPTVMRCAPLDDFRAVIDRNAGPTVPGATCVLGNLTLWIDNVTLPDVLYDPERFRTDPNYAARMADFNLLTYLIDHKDGRRGNFLVSKNERDRRVFAVDNGISFDAWIWNYFVPNWNDIRVPALRKESVDRLRKVTDERLERLAVLAELRLSKDGVLESVPPGPPKNGRSGVYSKGGLLQLGLKRDEVEDVREHIDEILHDVDTGRLPVF
jgi:hypothetical protein